MSGGGGGGIIIIHRLLEDPSVIKDFEDREFLRVIADRNPVKLSRSEVFQILMILWRHLRS